MNDEDREALTEAVVELHGAYCLGHVGSNGQTVDILFDDHLFIVLIVNLDNHLVWSLPTQILYFLLRHLDLFLNLEALIVLHLQLR